MQWLAKCWRTRRGRISIDSRIKNCEKCGQAAVVFEYRPSPEGSGSERYFCESCARKTLWIPNPGHQHPAEAPDGCVTEIRVEVEKIIYFSDADEQLLVLREIGGQRRISFTTGCYEATAVWRALKREPSPRPLTHQAWINTVVALGARIQSTCVVSSKEATYFAEVRLIHGGERIMIDVRPSDALMFAIQSGVPLLFVNGLLAVYGILDPEPA